MKPEDFEVFFKAVNGSTPFPWQKRLAQKVMSGGWPSALNIPTACGKTMVLDIAIFMLALQGEHRTAPLRTFYVVDRRLVVDEVTEHAHLLERKIQGGGEPILLEVKDSLMRFRGDAPLKVFRLRGGINRNEKWAEMPNSPLICVSTVDQIGSRLLFRGYGASEGNWPILAGLVGCDSLIIVDEAHLSYPFVGTLAEISRYQAWADLPVSRPLQFVQMSATLQSKNDISLDEDDFKDRTLNRRLTASKKAKLIEAEDGQFEREIVNEAVKLGKSGAHVIGVILNRVASARKVHEELGGVLIIGRSRPYDADKLMGTWLPRIKNPTNPDQKIPLFVVTTQTIEVGVNIDFDALVTEAAPLDALKQRFGRLNRFGEKPSFGATVVLRKEKIKDPIYGNGIKATWKLLKKCAGKRGTVDFGVKSFDGMLKGCKISNEEELYSPHHKVPVLFPSIIEMLAQTSPKPYPDPDISPFLHGLSSDEAPDVNLIWRNDVGADWKKAISAVSPMMMEAMGVPLYAVRAWLEDKPDSDVFDVEGAEVHMEESGRIIRPVFRYKGRGKIENIEPKDIRPGDTLVVPSKYGGCDEYGWNPGSGDCVKDIADISHNERAYRLLQDGMTAKFLLRLNSTLIETLFGNGTEEYKSYLQALRAMDDVNMAAAVQGILQGIWPRFSDMYSTNAAMLEAFRRIKDDKYLEIIRYSEGLILYSIVKPVKAKAGSNIVTLTEHLSDVCKTTRTYAGACGLNTRLVEDLALAATTHDLGKSDPRFQLVLYGGDEIEAASGTLLAKSLTHEDDITVRRDIYRRSGYPRGARHELLSVALLDNERNTLSTAQDKELVRYLVGTHHGKARPFPQAVKDNSPMTVSLDLDGKHYEASSNYGLCNVSSGWVDQFWSLFRRYGPWGLAYLEAILRLGDHNASRMEEGT